MCPQLEHHLNETLSPGCMSQAHSSGAARDPHEEERLPGDLFGLWALIAFSLRTESPSTPSSRSRLAAPYLQCRDPLTQRGILAGMRPVPWATRRWYGGSQLRRSCCTGAPTWRKSAQKAYF